MQNFDFNSLYDEGNSNRLNRNWTGAQSSSGSALGDNGPKESGASESSFSGNKGEKNGTSKNKKLNRLITFFFIAIVLSFTFGLIAGIKLTAKDPKSSQLIDPHTQAFLDKIAQKDREKNLAERKPEPQKKLSHSRFFVKIFPAMSSAKARKLARILLANDLSVHYSQLSNGNYFLYTGPYKKEETGKLKLKFIKSLKNMGNGTVRLKLFRQ